ncbi:hypothetical protein BASA81_005163 [Batrachochytrium salamandrivorans]|nr:hypothetical protein BASA81_005163 [Batrachochytrium salamandrivorans]
MLTSQKTKFNPDSDNPARDIDNQVRQALATSSSLYNIHEDQLLALKPQVILTQSLCEVCSVDLVSVERLVHREMRGQCEVLDLNPQSLNQVLEDLIRVGKALGVPQAGELVANELKQRVHQAVARVVPTKKRPNVFFLEWTDPVFVGGHWTPEIIQLAGGTYLYNSPGSKSVCIRDELAVIHPQEVDICLVCLCGIDLVQTRNLMRIFLNQPEKQWFKQTKAFTNQAVVLIDGNVMFNRPGPRLVDCLEFCVDLFASWKEGGGVNLPPNDFPAEMLTID